jgi:SAM-dependent methyltransferase
MKEFEEKKENFCYNSQDYENSHLSRINYLIEDLKLDTIKNSCIVDFGCSDGAILKKLSSLNNNNDIYGIDFYDYKNTHFKYMKADFDYPFSKSFFELSNNKKADIGMCFEVCEHIPNLYNFLCEMKNIVKIDGIVYLSIPHEVVTHNTFYPGLFYPVNNFIEFLEQMAFPILEHKIHNKAFTQHVFTLTNKDWNFSKMKWYKNEEKFRNVSPLVAINL